MRNLDFFVLFKAAFVFKECKCSGLIIGIFPLCDKKSDNIIAFDMQKVDGVLK